MADTHTLVRGAPVWVSQGAKRAASWVPARLRSLDAGIDACEVEMEDGAVVRVSRAMVLPANQSQGSLADMTQLSHLNEPSLLHNLAQRYQEDLIYTFAGPVLVALNPCKPLPLYTPETANLYKDGAKLSQAPLDPHIYLVAANAFRAMAREGKSQSMIISGESGAGKTETTKKAMQFFATLSGGNGIEEEVLQSNPILEAFGNAKTLRNHNSSRFGKLIQIQFNHTHRICGARIDTYLLEKSRVVRPAPGERSYHIFYQLVRGASPQQRSDLGLPPDPAAFHYLAASGCSTIDGVDDGADFGVTRASLSDVGISGADQEQMWRVLSGVLWLGNVGFVGGGAGGGGDGEVGIVDAAPLEQAAALLCLPQASLAASLTSQELSVRGELICRRFQAQEAAAARDALAKAIYAGLFDWLVGRINARLAAGRKSSGLHISILDIFGFEQFQSNSFEQLCINYANERLQKLFSKTLFQLEQQEYEAEGLDVGTVVYVDNQECVDLIDATFQKHSSKGLGVLVLLDEQCRLRTGSDATFIQRLRDAHEGHLHFAVNPRCASDFILHHFAGQVQYTATGFLEKNKDLLSPDLVGLLKGSGHALVAPVGQDLARGAGDKKPGGAGATVSTRFRSQMQSLMAALEEGGLHFVRCIKPNDALAPSRLEAGAVLHQLRCAGVLEVVRIAKIGYPTRFLMRAFLQRYNVLLPGVEHWRAATVDSLGGACKQLLAQFGLDEDQFHLGKTKIFFRAGALAQVEDRWALMTRLALLLQACARRWLLRTWFRSHRRAAIAMQSSCRARDARLRLAALRQRAAAAACIQRGWRRAQARRAAAARAVGGGLVGAVGGGQHTAAAAATGHVHGGHACAQGKQQASPMAAHVDVTVNGEHQQALPPAPAPAGAREAAAAAAVGEEECGLAPMVLELQDEFTDKKNKFDEELADIQRASATSTRDSFARATAQELDALQKRFKEWSRTFRSNLVLARDMIRITATLHSATAPCGWDRLFAAAAALDRDFSVWKSEFKYRMAAATPLGHGSVVPGGQGAQATRHTTTIAGPTAPTAATKSNSWFSWR